MYRIGVNWERLLVTDKSQILQALISMLVIRLILNSKR